MAGQSDDKLISIESELSGNEAKAAWARPVVQRLRAGAAEEGSTNVVDFGQSES